MEIKPHLGLKILCIASLLLAVQVTAFADCAVLSVAETAIWAAADAKNTLFKDLFLGMSAILFFGTFVLSIVRSKRWVWAASLGMVMVPLQLGFAFAESMAAECGNAGVGAQYYAFQLIGLLILFAFQFILWRSSAKRSDSLLP